MAQTRIQREHLVDIRNYGGGADKTTTVNNDAVRSAFAAPLPVPRIVYIPTGCKWDYLTDLGGGSPRSLHPDDVTIIDDSGWDWNQGAAAAFSGMDRVIYKTANPGAKNAYEKRIEADWHPAIVIDVDSAATDAELQGAGMPRGMSSVLYQRDGFPRWIEGLWPGTNGEHPNGYRLQYVRDDATVFMPLHVDRFGRISLHYGSPLTGSLKRTTDAAATAGSSVLTSAAGLFVAGDVGRKILIRGAGTGGGTLEAAIASYTSPTQINLDTLVITTVSGALAVWGDGPSYTYGRAEDVPGDFIEHIRARTPNEKFERFWYDSANALLFRERVNGTVREFLNGSSRTGSIDRDFRFSGQKNTVSAYTASQVLSAYQSGTDLTNKGAAGNIQLTLPSAEVGHFLRFTVLAAFELRVLAPTPTDKFRGATSGQYKTSSTVGDRLEVYCVETGVWEFRETGTWATV